MSPSPANQRAIREALKDVTRKAVLAESCGNLDAMIDGLNAVRDACLRAAMTIRTAEAETRQAALAELERKYAA